MISVAGGSVAGGLRAPRIVILEIMEHRNGRLGRVAYVVPVFRRMMNGKALHFVCL